MKIFFRPEAYTAHTFSNRASSFSRFVFCVLCILSSSFSFRILCSVQTIITYHCILNILYSVMIYSVMICSVMIYSLIIYSVFAVQTRVTSVPAEVISRLSTKSPQSQSNHAHPPSSSRKVGQKIKNKWNLRGKNEITNWKRPPIGGPQSNHAHPPSSYSTSSNWLSSSSSSSSMTSETPPGAPKCHRVLEQIAKIHKNYIKNYI